jgi:hypothetical protein
MPASRQPTPGVDPAWTWLLATLGAGLLFRFLCGGSAGGTALSEFPLDDAWIHQVYARSLMQEGRLAYNPGVWESGASSLAWAVALLPTQALALWTGVWPVVGAKLTSLAFAVLAAVGAARLAARLGAGSLAQGCTVGLVLVTPGFAFSAVSGMEPTLTAAALAWAWAELAGGRRWRSGAWFALAVLARPESAVVVAVAGLAAVVGASSWRDRARAGLAVGGPAVLALGGWCLLNLFTTGYPLPNTFYFKASAGHLGERWAYVWHQIALAGGPLVLSIQCSLVAGGLWWASRRGRGTAVVAWSLFASIDLTVLAMAMSRPMLEPVLFYTQRYFYPFTMLFAPLAALALEAVPRSRVAWVIAAAVVLVETPGLLGARTSYRWHCSDIRTLHTTPALRARTLVPPGETVGVEGAGATRYLMDRRIVDLMGLNDHDLAHARNDGRRFACLLLARDPRWMILPGGMMGAVATWFELRPVEEYRVARWSVIGGLEGRSVFLVRASPRPALVAGCHRLWPAAHRGATALPDQRDW